MIVLVYIKPISMIPRLHSDRLFGAILSAISEIYPIGIIDEIKKSFENQRPPFLISSTFPAIRTDENRFRFFPRIMESNKFSDISADTLKDYKKVNYLEESIFFDLLNGKVSEREILENYDEYNRFKDILIKKENLDFNYVETVLPNNSINRLTNQTDIFYTTGINYGDNVELFFFIEILDEKYESILKSSLKFLKDRGLGPNISVGKGQFTYEIDNLNVNDLGISSNFDNETKFITLSRFIPNDEDLSNIDEFCNYEIGSKRSRDKNGELRKQIKFFNEGSTFCHSNKFYGKVVDVGDKKPAIEYGYAFPIPYNKKVIK